MGKKKYKDAKYERGWFSTLPPYRQDPVLRAAEKRGLIVWSVEYKAGGRRRYYTAGIREFWIRYLRRYRNGERLCWYEGIKNGEPIKLFFDLEGPPGTDLDSAIRELKSLLEPTFGTPGIAMVFESSRPTKVSRHVIFLNWIVGSIDQAKTLVLAKRPFFSPNLTRAVDHKVYTPNRQFRLYLSQKFGGSPILDFHSIDLPRSEFNPIARHIFEAHLVSWIPYQHTVTQIPMAKTQPKSASIKKSNQGSGQSRYYKETQKITMYVHGTKCKWIGRAHNRRYLIQIIDVAQNFYWYKCEKCAPNLRFGKTRMTPEQTARFVSLYGGVHNTDKTKPVHLTLPAPSTK